MVAAKWDKNGEIRFGKDLAASVDEAFGGDWLWWIADGSGGRTKTVESAKRAAERALVKYGRKLVKAGGGE